MSIAEDVHAALKAEGLEIDGLAMSESDPKEKWRVIWPAPPSPEDEGRAAAVIDAFDAPAARARRAALEFLRKSDVSMARAVEDVIAALISTAAVPSAAFPEPVLELVAARKLAREAIAKPSRPAP